MSDTVQSELSRLYSKVPNANCCGKCIDSCHNVPAFAFEPIVALKLGFNRVGKRKAGALLDGAEWKQFPTTS